jgi:hypothetical protein
MTIRVLLQNDHAFGPEEIRILVAAYEDALAQLQLTRWEDPATLLVAKRIIDLAREGERDPMRLREGAPSARGQGETTGALCVSGHPHGRLH